MGKRIKLENTKIGKWSVISYLGLVKRRAMYLCQCDCGKLSEIRADYLLHGNPKCGVECPFEFGLIGKVFGRLTVLKFSHKGDRGEIYWECKCNCGNTTIVSRASLISGYTQSCGCLQKEVAIKLLEIARGSRIIKSIILNCDFCDKEILVSPSKIERNLYNYCSQECRSNHQKTFFFGKNHPNWKDDKIDRDLRKCSEYYTWRNEVFKKDNYKCNCCKDSTKKLNAHHLKSFSRFPELKFDVTNGITLCKDCHISFHSIYGIRIFTSDDYYEFIKEKGVDDGGFNTTL